MAHALPPDVLQTIRKKSSRDPMSRFSSKLHILLDYAGDDRVRQEMIGAGWETDDSFRINKKCLVNVMDIKMNTLNVNLKDRSFRQLSASTEGWSLWQRTGFERGGLVEEGHEMVQTGRSLADENVGKVTALSGLALGMTAAERIEKFKLFTIGIWEELTGLPTSCCSTPSEEFIAAAAKRFRAPHQKFDNAVTILRVVFDVERVVVRDFARFMARFGPEETIMLKIQSLLRASNDNGNWLKINATPAHYSHENIFGCFDNREDNCIVIRRFGRSPERVYNDTSAAATEDYLIDTSSNKYKSWQGYFERNPVTWIDRRIP